MVLVREIELKNFRRLDDTCIQLGGAGVYLLLGPNGAGKSTVLAALKLIREGFAAGRPSWRDTVKQADGYAGCVTRGREGQMVGVDVGLAPSLNEIKPSNVSFGSDVDASVSPRMMLDIPDSGDITCRMVRPTDRS